MNVADVMTKEIATCGTDDSLNRVAQLMWDRRCGCLPVLGDKQRVVGIVTDRDVSMAAYTQGRRLDDIAVTTVMSYPVSTCQVSASVEEAEDLMMAHGVRRLVVVDSNGRACGLLSLDDIARHGAAWDGTGDIDLERVAITLGEIARGSHRTDEERPDTQLPESEITEFVENSLAAIKTLRDEIRVDLNLAGKEVRDRWRRLEVRLQAAEKNACHARRDAAGDLAGLVQTAKQFRSRLLEKSTAAAPQPR